MWPALGRMCGVAKKRDGGDVTDVGGGRGIWARGCGSGGDSVTDRVCWRGDAADSGIITETSWDAVTIAWSNGQVASVHHGDMREIERVPTKVHIV